MKKIEITHTLYADGKPIEIVLKKVVKPFGGSSHVILPKCLIGERVEIIFRGEDESTDVQV